MKTSQRIITTKRLLKEGLLRLLEKNDLPTITITQLCNESGINRSTFYRHYNTPHDVVVEFEKDFVDEFRQAVQTPHCAQDTEKYLAAVCRYLYDHADIMRILFRNHIDSAFAQYVNSIYRTIWMLQNKLTPCTSDTLPLVLSSLGGGGYFLLREWLLKKSRKSPEEVAGILLFLIENQL